MSPFHWGAWNGMAHTMPRCDVLHGGAFVRGDTDGRGHRPARSWHTTATIRRRAHGVRTIGLAHQKIPVHAGAAAAQGGGDHAGHHAGPHSAALALPQPQHDGCRCPGGRDPQRSAHRHPGVRLLSGGVRCGRQSPWNAEPCPCAAGFAQRRPSAPGRPCDAAVRRPPLRGRADQAGGSGSRVG